MTTPLDIITASLKKAGILGIGQSAIPEDVNDAYDDLNDMLSQWQRKRWLIWHLVDLAFTSTGAQSYSVGPGGNFNVLTRPDRLEAAFFRQTIQSQPNQIDYPLEIIEARETYNDIALKNLTSFASYIFYDSAFPMGYIYPWPVPNSSIYEIHITIKEQLNQFTSLGQVISLPLEYFAAMKWNLALRMRVNYQLPPNPYLIGLAKDSLNTIRNANTQIPRLRMPTDLIRPGVYNPYSDQIR
jgi:hypothetical protein